MKKIIFVILLVVCITMNTKGQIVIERETTTNYLPVPETREVKIWLPKDRADNPPTQVIYVFDASVWFDIVAANVNALSFYGDIPSTAVVGVYFSNNDDRMDVGYNPGTRRLDKYGESFHRYLTEDLPNLMREYVPEESYSIFFGHSYLGDYGAWHIENHADMFDAYILLAPEEEDTCPDFEGSDLSNKRIYIAVGSKDQENRIEYAQMLYNMLVPAVGTATHIKSEVIHNADHFTLMSNAIAPALLHIYKDYVYGFNIDSFVDTGLSINDNYLILSDSNRRNYKTGLPKDASTLLGLYFEYDEMEFEEYKTLVKHFEGTSNPSLMQIIGEIYSDFDDHESSIYWLNRSIEQFTTDNLLQYMYGSVDALYKIYYNQRNDVDKAYNIMADYYKIYDRSLSPKYYMGVLDIVHNRDIKRGIDHLLYYLENYELEIFGKPIDQVNYYIALGYYKMNDRDNAEYFLSRSLTVNPENGDAQNLMTIIKG